jgi:hypothetical protein
VAAPAAEPQIPAPAKALQREVAAKLQPSVRDWISIEAKKMADDSAIGEASVTADVKARFAGQRLRDADIETLVTLVLVQAAQDATKDLQIATEEVKTANRQKATVRQTAATGPRKQVPSGDSQVSIGTAGGASTSEVDQTQSLRLQVAMDRRSKFLEMLSKSKAKKGKNQSRTIGNLK